MSVSEWTEGLHRRCCCLRQPLSQTFGLPAPRKGEPFGCGTNSSDKPPSLREVDFAKQKLEGVSLP